MRKQIETTVFYEKNECTVFGYIREFEEVPLDTINIPMVIKYLVNKFYHTYDEFDAVLHGKGVTISHNQVMASNILAPWSAFLTKVVSKYQHHWRFVTLGKVAIYIGVRANTTDPTSSELNLLHYPYGTDAKNGSFGLHLITGHPRGDPQRTRQKYCPPCEIGDVIDMYLDLNNYHLSFAINNKHYGKAFDVDKTSYRAACCLSWEEESLELLFYKTMH
eukprot:494637_1